MSKAELPGPVVLASKSPERRRLLAGVIPQFQVVVPGVDESKIHGEAPGETALKRAQAKARQVARERPDALVIAADTVVECEGRLLGKPRDREHARRMLRTLGSRPHSVVTALCVVTPDGREATRVAATEMHMKEFTEEQIEHYASQPGALERAGVYALQHPDPNVRRLEGSPSCVQGLPLEELDEILESLYPASRAERSCED